MIAASAPSGDLSAWLDAAGLGHVAPAMLREGVTLAQRAELTDSDLRELGLSLGDRLRFRAALKETSEQAAAARTFPERRPLTVMFIDVVDSTGLSDRLEIEDLIEVIRRYREFCDSVIRKFGGHVAQFFGDGIMAYFCYPVGHENDAERAVRAALDIAQGMRLQATPAGAPVRVRIGIATGRVVISDLFSGGSMEQRKVSGATPNLAARLQGFARPDGVVISELTHGLVGTLFECDDAGRQDLRGFGAPQHVFHVLRDRAGTGGSRLSGAPLTPLFGRETELEALTGHWQRVAAGQGGCIVVTGEAGIGKSRLVERFLGTLSPASASIVRIQGSALDLESPLYPFVSHFRLAAGFESQDGPGQRLAKLRGVLGGPEQHADVAALAELLQMRADGLSAGPSAGLSAGLFAGLSAGLPPAVLRSQALAAISRQLLALAEAAPLCLVVEDLHWIDATSLALLAQLAGNMADKPILLLATTRDEARAAKVFPAPGPAWIRLARLHTSDVLAMLHSLFGDDPVPADVAQQIARQTDGIPLFVEEYVRPFLVANARADWTNVAPRSAASMVIPTSLHESLMARLDRSGAAKEVAQIASVIGRTARRDVLVAASGLPRDRLDNALAVLQGVGVLHPVLDDGTDAVAFGHALVREAAYDSILRDRRRELHARVAEAMAAVDPESVELQPELLATHLTEGGMPERALDYWVKASERSVRRSSLFEALGLLRRALSALDGLPATPDRLALRLRLMTLLGPALIAVRGPGSAEAQALYADAYRLAEHAGDTRFHFPLAWGWWRVARNFTLKKQRAATLLVRAEARRDDEMLLQAHHCNWAANFELGDLCTCEHHVQAGLQVYASGNYAHHASMYGNHDARVCGYGELSQVYWMQGRLAAAAGQEALAMDWAAQLGHLGSRVHAMDMALLHRSFQRDNQAVRALSAKLMAFTAEHGLLDHRAKGQIFAGWAMARDGEVAPGMEAIRRGMARQREIGTIEDFPMYVSMLAETLVAAGQADRAVEELTAARAEFDAVGLRIWLPEMLRHLGRAIVAADPGSLAPAQATLAEAAAMARQQGARMLGLRIALDQAALAERAGDPGQAHAVLAAALAAMPPAEDAPETAQAAARIAHWRTRGSSPPSRAA